MKVKYIGKCTVLYLNSSYSRSKPAVAGYFTSNNSSCSSFAVRQLIISSSEKSYRIRWPSPITAAVVNTLRPLSSDDSFAPLLCHGARQSNGVWELPYQYAFILIPRSRIFYHRTVPVIFLFVKPFFIGCASLAAHACMQSPLTVVCIISSLIMN